MPSNDCEVVENCADLSAYNHSELLQLCWQAGYRPHPSRTREQLAEILEGRYEEVEEENPLDDFRFGIMSFLLEHWKRASSQLFCPAKSGDPNACRQCVDAQVIHCLTTNPKIEPGVLAQIRRRNNER